jgi:hypothetical protein
VRRPTNSPFCIVVLRDLPASWMQPRARRGNACRHTQGTKPAQTFAPHMSHQLTQREQHPCTASTKKGGSPSHRCTHHMAHCRKHGSLLKLPRSIRGRTSRRHVKSVGLGADLPSNHPSVRARSALISRSFRLARRAAPSWSSCVRRSSSLNLSSSACQKGVKAYGGA